MIAMREAWGTELVEQANRNERIVVLDGDLANSTKADLFARAHPERFLQLGIAEQNMIGVAAGMAASGFIPWLSSFAVFFTHRGLDQIRMVVAQSEANVKIGAAYSGLLTGATGKTHQDVQDLAIMRAMPGMVVLAPGDARECVAMMRWASAYDGPVYLRLARDPTPELPRTDKPFAIGEPVVMRAGTDMSLVSTGPQTARALDAAEMLAEKGMAAKVIHVGSIKPLDREALLAELDGTDQVVTVEEHSVYGGLGGLVSEITAEAGGGKRVTRMGISDVWGESASDDFLLERHGLSVAAIVDHAVKVAS